MAFCMPVQQSPYNLRPVAIVLAGRIVEYPRLTKFMPRICLKVRKASMSGAAAIGLLTRPSRGRSYDIVNIISTTKLKAAYIRKKKRSGPSSDARQHQIYGHGSKLLQLRGNGFDL
eukprot:TRINITY_DN3901_c0_g2_i1.p1 TRINITY_DN3901_c0_g2~~TRINITY_DN3901_c0_g2_i1.p1  ORF type:complete len:116 (+),score=1.26 TRINITY_DN3901_c0_g2_i1:747-1094(+)